MVASHDAVSDQATKNAPGIRTSLRCWIAYFIGSAGARLARSPSTILSDPDEVLSSLIAGSGTTFRGPNSGPCGSHCGRAMVFPSQRMPGKRPEKWPESRGWPQAQTLRSPGAPSTLPRVNVMASLYGRETLRLPA